jgi:ABC-type sugar transport system ATPase subunit
MTVIEVHNARKRFRNTHALDGIDLTLRSGEILGIAGPNGAGKSTLTRVLSGEESLDSGEIRIDGQILSISDVGDLVAVVHQEPQVWLNMTVAENLIVGNEDKKFALPVPSTEQLSVLERIGIAQVSDIELAQCSLAVRQRVEIARALVRRARVFLFDEPNSTLTDDESKALFSFMHELADTGHVVALITHRLAELVNHCNRVVVIRDGRVATELTGERLTETAIAGELVAGKQHISDVKQFLSPIQRNEPLVTTRSWQDDKGAFQDISLEIFKGEIVAIVGVEGSGGREIVAALGGMRRAHGEVVIDGTTGESAQGSRIAYLPADRTEMLFHNMTVADNLMMRLGRPTISNRFGWLLRGKIRSAALLLVKQYSVRTDGTEQMITTLSGGNQQKIAIAAAMASNPSVLLVEEPTRGVDVGSKREIYEMLRVFTGDSRAVIGFCTEASEAFELADRVIVVQRGACRSILRPRDFSDVESFASALADLEMTSVTESSPQESVDFVIPVNPPERKEFHES